MVVKENGNYTLFEELVEKIAIDRKDEEAFIKQYKKILLKKVKNI